MNKQPRLKVLLREPLLHFLLIGGLLFFIYGLQNETVSKNRITVSEADIDRLITIWEKKRLRLPTQTELQGLIEQQIREQVMYREALSMGLDQNDAIVRKRLAQKVEFISSDIVATIEPSNDELIEYLNTNAKNFETPARLSFEQIYFSRDKRGANTEPDALSILANLKENNSTIDTRVAGDPFMMGQQHDEITEYGVSRLFGKDFATKLFILDAGDWQGPITSGYGLHLIRINNKTLSQIADLNLVKDKVRTEWKAEQRRLINERFYEGLRQRYDIVIESSIGNKLASANPNTAKP